MAWCNKGNSLNRLGKPQEAIACCDRVLEINSEMQWHGITKGLP